MKTIYEILEIEPTDNFDIVKKAYRQMALELHPDKYKDNLSSEEKKQLEIRFKELSVAYEAVNTPEDLKRYFERYCEESTSSEGPDFEDTDFDDGSTFHNRPSTHLINSGYYAGALHVFLNIRHLDEIKTSSALMMILCEIGSSGQLELLRDLRTRLPFLIKNINNFTDMLSANLESYVFKGLLNILKKELPLIFSEIKSLQIAKHATSIRLEEFSSAKSSRHGELLHALNDHWPSLVKNSSDFWRIFSALLTPEECVTTLKTLYEYKPTILDIDIDSALESSGQEEATAQINKHPPIINNSKDFAGIPAPFLSNQHCVAILKTLHECNPIMFSTAKARKEFLSYLTPEQRTFVKNALKHIFKPNAHKGHFFGLSLSFSRNNKLDNVQQNALEDVKHYPRARKV